MSADTSARVLVVEDCLDDEAITLRALRGSAPPLDVQVARDGPEAESALGLDEGSPSFEPDLVLLSLEGRGDEGDAVLARARREPRLARLPIVVLESAVEQDAATRSLAAGASAYATKPIDTDAYMRMIRTMVGRWLPNAAFGP